ncbi:MAG: hypothetical protein JSW00_02160 [Thermoplasmata archaeon]|nr:MAG: hypothetical protein JSW00_02160 [Thermoplasmata archaeon]
MEIREMQKNEIAQVVEYYSGIVPPRENKEEDQRNFENEISKAFGSDHMLLALEDNKIVGFLRSQIQLNQDGKKVDRVIMLLIPLDRLGEGIGGQLIEREREYAKIKGADVLDIEIG